MKIYDYKGRKNISGNRIREARLKKRLSQADFAAKLQIAGITMERDSVSRIEIGTRFVADYELMIIAENPGRNRRLVTVRRLRITQRTTGEPLNRQGLLFFCSPLDNIIPVLYNIRQKEVTTLWHKRKLKRTNASERNPMTESK